MFILWFVLTSAAVLYGQSLLFRKLVLRRLTYKRQFRQKTCVRGEEIELVEQLENRKWLPVPWLRVESQLSAHLGFRKGENFDVSRGELYQNHRSFFSLGGYTRVTRTHRITPLRRGCYSLSTVTLTGGDLLGNTYRHTQIPLEGELIVYPKPAEVPFRELPTRSWQGEHSVRRFIVPDPFVVAGAREYQPGDTMKQVNWKASARTGTLQVHQYDYTADRNIMLIVNVDDAEGMWRSVSNEELIEQGIEWAAGAAEAAISQGMEVGFTANMPLAGSLESARIEPDRGYEHLTALYEAMARLKLTRTEPFLSLLEREALLAYANRDVLVISSYWNEELEDAAIRLRANGNSVTVWELLAEERQSDFEADLTASRVEGGRSA
ncbi:DUF58 domain-containing protein [Paenibacillus nanensis]|uniref:DUF58 domain-containing protein n=1 Tax=Paenibacillus nanensis TaxID=393251 RepID=A0A3A1UYS1_9BACL|nr:DUF58 domain-containing protein [Paenibacillus nanensis]RIX53638.1 DUF58 domain-containing protein [Paenibacillus nanensis]